MSKADKMFKELGYIVEEGRINVFIGRGKKDEDFSNDFIIHKKSKSITIYKMLISIQELQAINEKVKELGWNE